MLRYIVVTWFAEFPVKAILRMIQKGHPDNIRTDSKTFASPFLSNFLSNTFRKNRQNFFETTSSVSFFMASCLKFYSYWPLLRLKIPRYVILSPNSLIIQTCCIRVTITYFLFFFRKAIAIIVAKKTPSLVNEHYYSWVSKWIGQTKM